MHEQLKRLLFAAVAIPVVLGIVWLGGIPLVLLLSAAAVLALGELFAFAEKQAIGPLRPFALASAALLPALTWYGVTRAPWLQANGLLLVGAWLLLALATALASRHPDEKPLTATAVTVFGVLYTAALPSYLLVIRHSSPLLLAKRDLLGGVEGFWRGDWRATWLVLVPLAITWIGDTAAMFGGKAVGGPKLAPRVSPGKTWSGSTFGFVATVGSTFLFDALVLQRFGVTLETWQLVLFGAVISVAGQVGDLAESLYKREVGVKDSSSLIPGHGGVLDRLDSLYFAIPAAAVLYRWFGVI